MSDHQPPSFQAPTYGANSQAPLGSLPAAPAPRGLAMSSMIVGIVSALIAWPLSFVGLVGGVVALVLGIVGVRKGQARGMALSGIITGAVAIVVALIMMILVAAIVATAFTDPSVQEQFTQLEELQQ